MLNVDGTPFVHWPPLFPLLLLPLLLIGYQTLFLLPLLSTGLLIWSWNKWITQLQLPDLLKGLGLLILLLHFAVSYTAPMLWTDLLFLAVLLFWLREMQLKEWKKAVFLFMILTLLRYAALFFIPLWIYFLWKNFKTNRLSGLANFLLSLLPISGWLLHTYYASGTISGDRAFPAEYFGDNIAALIEVTGRWIFPAQFPFFFHVCGFLLLLLLPIWLMRQYPYVILAHLSYALGLLSSYFLFDFQEPDARLALPLLPAFLLSVLLLFKKYRAKGKQFLLLLLLCWAIYSIGRGAKAWISYLQGEQGKYNQTYWTTLEQSDLCAAIEEHKASESQVLLSNDAHGLVQICNQTAIIWPKDIYHLPRQLPGSGLFIWFNKKDIYQLYAPTAILSVYDTDTLLQKDKYLLMRVEKHNY